MILVVAEKVISAYPVALPSSSACNRVRYGWCVHDCRMRMERAKLGTLTCVIEVSLSYRSDQWAAHGNVDEWCSGDLRD